MEVYPIDTSHDHGIEMKLPLREDIGAELDDFLFLSLLGIGIEARESIRTILWRHLRYFPIFAEVADYVIDKMDTLLQMQLLESIRRGDIQFTDPDERMFLSAIEEILSDERLVTRRLYAVMESLTQNFADWDSPILCHLFQIRVMLTVRNPERDFVDTHYIRQILTLSQMFLERQMLEDSIRCFSIATSSPLPTDHGDIPALHQGLERALGLLLEFLSGNVYKDQDEARFNQHDADALVVRISYLRFLNAVMSFDSLSNRSLADRIDKLLPETQKFLVSVFNSLPDPCPRGDCFELCDRLGRPELKAIRKQAKATIHSAPTLDRGIKEPQLGTEPSDTITDSASPVTLLASNFIPGATEADIETAFWSDLFDKKGRNALTSCRIVSRHPSVVAEMVLSNKYVAENILRKFHNLKVDGRILKVVLSITGPESLSQRENSSQGKMINADTAGLGPDLACIAPDYERRKALSSDYKLRTGLAATEFFVKGRVFALVWHETHKSSSLVRSNSTKISAPLGLPFCRYAEDTEGVTVYSYERRFVVAEVSATANYCLAIPIHTYPARRPPYMAMPINEKQDHAIIYVDKGTPYEAPAKVKINKQPIAMHFTANDYLERDSGLDFGKAQRVALDVRMRDIGRVLDPTHLRRLTEYLVQESPELFVSGYATSSGDMPKLLRGIITPNE